MRTGPSAERAGRLLLHGLLIEGPLTVLAGNLGGLTLAHTTLVPRSGGLTVNASASANQQNSGLALRLTRSIAGPVELPDSVAALELDDSIVDAGTGAAIRAPGAAVAIRASTIFGTSEARELDASETIFTQDVVAQRRQVGCVRFSFVTESSKVPRRYRCQPSLALAAATDANGASGAAEEALILGRVRPAFTSTRYGNPVYGQLWPGPARPRSARAARAARRWAHSTT